MSIRFGVFDFFAYTIPGGIYLVLAMLISHETTLGRIWISKIPVSASTLLIGGVLSYVIGILFAGLSKNPWYRLFGPRSASTAAYQRISKTYPDVSFNFGPKQYPAILKMLRLRDTEAGLYVDKHRATAIMLRNLSFSLLCLAVGVLALYCRGNNLVLPVISATILFVMSAFGATGSHKFSEWAHASTFEYIIGDTMTTAKLVVWKSEESSAEADSNNSEPADQCANTRPAASQQ